MGFFDVYRCLGGWEVNCVFDSVKYEPNHLLLGVEVSISRRYLLGRNQFLAISLLCY